MEGYQVISPTQTPDQDQWSLTPLYKVNDRGKDAIWQVSFDGVDSLIMEFGQIGGAIRTTRTEVKPKSKRNMQEQALLDARARYKRKYQKDGYRPAGEEAPIISSPMLANKWNPGETKLDFPVWTQPKLDGIRMLAHLEDGEVVVRSRQNEPFYFLDHIKAALKDFFTFLPNGAILDGELYSHELTFNRIVGLVKRSVNKDPEITSIDYYIFDIILPENPPYKERYKILLDAYDAYFESGFGFVNEEVIGPLRLVANTKANSEEDLLDHRDDYLKIGYEGLIIRKISEEESRYVPKRSNNILKYKPFLDEEAEVIGVKDARGTEKGIATLIVRDERGNEFTVRPRGSFEMRREWLENPELVIGKNLTIRYQELTPDGIPRFPVGVVIRDYE